MTLWQRIFNATPLQKTASMLISVFVCIAISHIHCIGGYGTIAALSIVLITCYNPVHAWMVWTPLFCPWPEYWAAVKATGNVTIAVWKIYENAAHSQAQKTTEA